MSPVRSHVWLVTCPCDTSTRLQVFHHFAANDQYSWATNRRFSSISQTLCEVAIAKTRSLSSAVIFLILHPWAFRKLIWHFPIYIAFFLQLDKAFSLHRATYGDVLGNPNWKTLFFSIRWWAPMRLTAVLQPGQVLYFQLLHLTLHNKTKNPLRSSSNWMFWISIVTKPGPFSLIHRQNLAT